MAFQPGIIPANSLVLVAANLQRAVALLLIGTSTLGNFVQFNGGWDRVRTFDEAGVQALVLAFIWQVVFFVWQFAMLRVSAWKWYFFALLASCGPSFLSYYGLTYEPIRSYIALFMGNDLAQVATFTLILIAVIGNDMIPEQVLVKR